MNINNHIKNATTSTFHHCCENTNENLSTLIQANKKKSFFNTYKNFSLLLRRSFSKSRNPKENKHSSNIIQSISATNIHLPLTNNNNNGENNNLKQKTNFTFKQQTKLHKILRTGNISAELLQKKLLLKKEQSNISLKSKKDFCNHNIANKSLSSDVIFKVNKASYVTEALFALADSQPIVARLLLF